MRSGLGRLGSGRDSLRPARRRRGRRGFCLLCRGRGGLLRLALLRQGLGCRLLGFSGVGAAGGDLGLDAVEHRVGDERAVEVDRPDGIIVARNRVVDPDRIGVRINDGDHRNVQFPGFRDGQVLLVRVEHEDHVRQAAHVLDAAKRPFELVQFPLQAERLALGQSGILLRKLFLELLQPLDGMRDGLPVRQHTAQPAVIDVILTAALGRLGDLFARLALGADEEHTPPA